MAIWPQLLPKLEVRILSCIDLNELAGTVRLVSKATAALLPSPKHTTIRLSQRVPPHAFAHRWGQPGAMRSLAYKERLQLLCLTAASGSIPNLEFLLPRVGCLPTAVVLGAAAAAGQLAVCQWLRQRGCPWGWSASQAAGQANRREVCEWLIAAGCPYATQGAACGAARGGHVCLLEWLLPLFEPDVEDSLLRVAEGCDVATLQRLHATLLGGGAGAEGLGIGGLSEAAKIRIMAAAAGSPTPDWRAKVEWLLAAGYPLCMDACVEAARRPDALERLAWLQARGFPFRGSVLWKASWMTQLSELDALERLLGVEAAQGAGVGARLYGLADSAAEHGHLELLQALHERGHVDASGVPQKAAMRGQLPVVAWAVEALGAEVVLTCALFTRAAASGSVELMAWLRERGCPWSADAYIGAANSGCEEALEWLAAHGCPAASGQFEKVCERGDLATLACLRRIGYQMDLHRLTPAACGFHVPVLRWLAENGYPLNWDVALGEADPNDAEMMAWLEEGKRQAAAGWGRMVVDG